MALARLAFNLSNIRVVGLGASSSSAPSSTRYLVGLGGGQSNGRLVGGSPRQTGLGEELLKRFMTTAGGGDKVAGETSDGKEVAVSDASGGRKSGRLFPRRKRRKGLWKSRSGQFVPALQEFFPSGLGNALLQATENINRLFDNLHLLPSNLTGRVKEKDDHYKLRYEVPGLSKEDLKITIDNGVLTIEGEHKEEEEADEDGSDDEHWSARSYGYYHASVVLPEDAKAEEVKAELKDGLLYVTVPRSEKPQKDVKEVKIN